MSEKPLLSSVVQGALALLLASWCVGALAAVTTITFEQDLPPEPPSFSRLTGYAGFAWSDGDGGAFADIFVINTAAFGNSLQPGFYAGVVSPTHVAFKSAGGSPDASLSTSRILSTSGVLNLDSAFFSSASGSQTLTFQGLKAGTPKYTQSGTVSQSAHTKVSFVGWLDIDELRITTNLPAVQWIMDDFSYSHPVPVPEPASWLLLALGLPAIGMAMVRRRPAAH